METKQVFNVALAQYAQTEGAVAVELVQNLAEYKCSVRLDATQSGEKWAIGVEKDEENVTEQFFGEHEGFKDGHVNCDHLKETLDVVFAFQEKAFPNLATKEFHEEVQNLWENFVYHGNIERKTEESKQIISTSLVRMNRYGDSAGLKIIQDIGEFTVSLSLREFEREIWENSFWDFKVQKGENSITEEFYGDHPRFMGQIVVCDTHEIAIGLLMDFRSKVVPQTSQA